MSIAFETISWKSDRIRIIDQTRLPLETDYLELRNVKEVWNAIKQLSVRGAPAIGITAAYGLIIGIREMQPQSAKQFMDAARDTASYLTTSRPTAVNLKWALDRILRKIENSGSTSVEELENLALKEAQAIHWEDKETCRSIGQHGTAIIQEPVNILTHCNTGSLATGQFGTAFSVIYHAAQQDFIKNVWVDETRPLLQGSRLTTWELMQSDIPFKLITDSMAGLVMQQGNVDMIVVGADRIASNGDTANKIGTYSLAVLARHHDIPFYIAAPLSTIDFSLENGTDIPIEERNPEEITHIGEKQIAPSGSHVYNPAFDVTPAELIHGIITQYGIINPPFTENLAKIRAKGESAELT